MKFTFAPEATPLAGYTIKRAIDRGGFGEVYYALSDSGKEVALKLLQRNQQVELRGVSQCLNLKHPNLVTIFDIRIDADDDHWVVMEYVSGKSLERVLEDNPHGLPLDDVESWLAGIAAGTAFLHDRGIVHRDLKPANVFRENGVVKIGDVGLSKFITPSRRSAQTDSVGTVYYMAPEVARGKYGSELDVYSLGVMLYEMLTGHVPFSGESTGEILMKHLTEPPDLSKIAAQFRGVVGRALEKDPHRRTPGAGRLLDEFRRARQGQPVAEEIPASHFVDVPQLERSAMLKPAAPAVAARRPVNGFPETAHYAGEPRGPGNPFTPPRPPRPPEPFARACGKIAGHGCRRFDDVCVRHPVLSTLLVAGFFSMFLFPALGTFGRVATPRAAWGEILLLAGASYFTYWCVKKAIGGQQLASNAGRQVNAAALDPRSAPRPVVAPQPTARPVVVQRPGAPPQARRVNPTLFSLNTVRDISLRSRMSDLTGAMTMAVMWGALATAAVDGLARNFPQLQSDRATLTTPGGLALFGFTTIIGSWAILVAAKLLEGTGAEGRQRRLIQTGLGAAVGACAWWLHDMLLVDLTYRNSFPGLLQHIGSFHLLTDSAVAQPSLAGYVVFFAALFGIRRWWWQADAFRSKRFRPTSVVFTGLVAFFVPAAFVFQQSWGVLWGIAISAVVQLSAPWVTAKDRPAIVAARIER